MLILFDLDDTLIDTSGSIIPYRFQQILHYLQRERAYEGSLEEGLALLHAISEQSTSTKETVKQFLHKACRKRGCFSHAFELLEAPLPKGVKVFLCPGVNQILRELHLFHNLALVTMGRKELQKQKWENAGLDCTLFCKIIVIEPKEESGKKKAYHSLAIEKNISKKQVVVCGDHIERDLIPAKELGFWTVLMRWGRGLRWTTGLEKVDFAISHLQELKHVICQLENKEKKSSL